MWASARCWIPGNPETNKSLHPLPSLTQASARMREKTRGRAGQRLTRDPAKDSENKIPLASRKLLL